ncbi:hypothetical protein DXG03_006870, partial [Asterophora parasitica]
MALVPPPQLPNLPAMVAAYDTLSHETALFANAGGFNLAAQLAAIQNSLNNLTNTVNNNHTAVSGRLTAIEGRLNGIDGRLDGIDGRLGGIDGRLDGIDGRLDGIDGRLGGIDGRLDGIDGRLDNIEGRIDGIDTHIDQQPMRLIKAVAAHDKPLRGSDLAVLTAPHPRTRDELLLFTCMLQFLFSCSGIDFSFPENQCTASATALRLPLLPN